MTMIQYAERLAELRYKDAVKEKLQNRRAMATKVTLFTSESIDQKVSTPHQYIEGLGELPIHVFRLSLGPTEAHIDSMIQSGVLVAENLYVGPKRWKEFVENAKVPQVMGRQIQNDAELAKIITDKDALATIQASVKEGNPYPIIYVMNHEARLAHAAYLGGRPNTQQEQIDIFEKIPGNNILDKATHAGIPFSGCFSAGNREFRSVGDWAFLMSSSAYRTGHRSLNLDRGFRDVNDSWGNPQLGFSALVVKDKK